MKTYSVVNLKGGVGKTTTVVNVAAILAAEYKKRVLVIDCDPQANATDFFGVKRSGTGTREILLGECADEPWNAIRSTEVAKLFVVPACMELINLDIARMSEADDGMVLRISDFLASLEDDFDVCLIDCPPSFTAASCAAIMASDEVIIPVKPDGFVLRGLTDLLDQIDSLQRVNPCVSVGGVLFTMYRKVEAAIVVSKTIRDRSDIPVYDSLIRFSDKVDEASIARQTLAEWSPYSSAGRDYRAFCAELMNGGMI